ncbi:bifunctional diaminohydroxyphosphoribosylaminopyrimidine deaminase/5-amino-6-(5-phosphoribosylamino)uracil reductase RibD [Belliella sp. DSM 111904]|uniref:Riboflavin biosynthesis protein RibD n=1 Tax=Belliella filtrata TaxID=2923435 RepID=A0ABS9UZR3_9BACT|nr:bifunctional diaminohydroxyphosphoribosylaminopyrimidine deaminase/5-amino-6-(5-phosphoribosylamino)uracil reductase RibD [Belliella filtrata]MCH7409573.1 bifunctional diaminohydroxyphosphoribosylaminopyrimidine deaminase/5-amino-6-(5-phosphoribosylamino)uracil reductase RibD [Belliella filtrata]
MEKHYFYMRRAMDLAQLGMGSVSPNPMVGCVIVCEDQIIAEGYHEYYGGPHAEPNAIAKVDDPELLNKSTVYVTLEPCAHFGKTPPCANLLVDKGVKKVVIGAVDTNPLVGGKGIAIMRNAGIEVIHGILEADVHQQNRRFFTFMEQNRPYITLKWAQSIDGFVARENFDSKWISNQYSRQLVHRWRTEEDAIMVGTNTARYDNPKLNVRDWDGKNPIRIVVDRMLQLDRSLALFDQQQPTICFNIVEEAVFENLEYVKLDPDFQIADIFKVLYERKIQSVLIEGGTFLLNKIIEAELWDEARVFTGQVHFNKGIPAPRIIGVRKDRLDVMGDALELWMRK